VSASFATSLSAVCAQKRKVTGTAIKARGLARVLGLVVGVAGVSHAREIMYLRGVLSIPFEGETPLEPAPNSENFAAPLAIHESSSPRKKPLYTLNKVTQADSLEYDYARSGPAVFMSMNGAHQIWIKELSQTGWLIPTKDVKYIAFEDLLKDALVSTDAVNWDGLVFKAPDFKSQTTKSKADRSIKVREGKWIGERLWLRIDLLRGDSCEGGANPKVGEGWIPAHHQNGNLNVVYHSRGC
jgi:hypothetical protein